VFIYQHPCNRGCWFLIVTISTIITVTKKILTTKFNYNIPTEQLKRVMTTAAPEFSEIPGCFWKIWLINEEQKEAGGVYLFKSVIELEQFLTSYMFELVKENPFFSNLQTNIFGVPEEPSLITGAPLMKMVI